MKNNIIIILITILLFIYYLYKGCNYNKKTSSEGFNNYDGWSDINNDRKIGIYNNTLGGNLAANEVASSLFNSNELNIRKKWSDYGLNRDSLFNKPPIPVITGTDKATNIDLVNNFWGSFGPTRALLPTFYSINKDAENQVVYERANRLTTQDSNTGSRGQEMVEEVSNLQAQQNEYNKQIDDMENLKTSLDEAVVEKQAELNSININISNMNNDAGGYATAIIERGEAIKKELEVLYGQQYITTHNEQDAHLGTLSAEKDELYKTKRTLTDENAQKLIDLVQADSELLGTDDNGRYTHQLMQYKNLNDSYYTTKVNNALGNTDISGTPLSMKGIAMDDLSLYQSNVDDAALIIAALNSEKVQYKNAYNKLNDEKIVIGNKYDKLQGSLNAFDESVMSQTSGYNPNNFSSD